MKGYIAFCPHFHQPHFQLLRTREEAYRNSYQPWLELLQKAVLLDAFYINLHYSGPLLYWFKDEKPGYLDQLNRILATGRAGIIGGLADEPFIQLSSRPDDYYFQLKTYNDLCYRITGIGADQWQGIHLVERECGELLLHEVTRAAGMIGAPALYYLDAETFYPSYFSYPGGENDYCFKHFKFKDFFSKTTIAHIPADMLYFGLRDEIGGQPFNAVPVHSQFRYQLLKRNGFSSEDMTRIKPSHYYFYIKDAIENAAQMAALYGRDLAPLVVIFEDAEKLGQWSKDPEGDVQWLAEFFTLVCNDKDLQFIGLKDYIEKVGIFDTYPVSSSHSYPEWENWTAKRGIRGVTFGDERLRRVMCRLRDMESRQSCLEELLLRNFSQDLTLNLENELADAVQRNLAASRERFEIIGHLLSSRYSDRDREVYEMVNRVRHVVYQEDPKWASRHPCYGSSPYYDMQGLAYLEIAERALEGLIAKVGGPVVREVADVTDWDFDGMEEIVIRLGEQTVCIDPEGGCITYHHVLSPWVRQEDNIVELLQKDMMDIKAYNSIYRYSCPLVFTETDSDLNLSYYYEGGRREICRNSCRCRVLVLRNDVFHTVGDFEKGLYRLEALDEANEAINVHLCRTEKVNTGETTVNITVHKKYMITPQSMSFLLEVQAEGKVENLFVSPQIVTSAAPSDEVYFHPNAYVGLKGAAQNIPLQVEDIAVEKEGGYEFHSIDEVIPAPAAVDYFFTLCSGDGSSFENGVSFYFNGTLHGLKFKPAVKHYYRDYVFAEQSRLGYHTSGLLIEPLVSLQKKQEQFQVDISWLFNVNSDRSQYQHHFELIEGMK
jgi:hypothetical protein